VCDGIIDDGLKLLNHGFILEKFLTEEFSFAILDKYDKDISKVK
jgi:hypothetical protein